MNGNNYWQICDHPPLLFDEKRNLCALCEELAGQVDALELIEQHTTRGRKKQK